ncbi:phosphoribosyl pyrophosphokinase [Piedraia hortae CBS 480.64]|uniref:Ribose-phosphate pyrophosphokinase 1 n=1 Tax=Piedraia hortae CBS 480.64 TaxID=1314780 RepID=A0A6A7C2V1_9PEZI|nr:phosphoribosyl pyrophosphokinase [Piedraia hortae CBS 480.64]
MRGTCIFSGSSHPRLVDSICERLACAPSKVQLKKFANGETSVEIQTSVRDRDVFIVQSGTSQINDSIMELLIMIAACKGGSSRSVTAVMPYFPYSRQSKKKTHRGAITARMIANLLDVAGVSHVITIDLHASQMQGFFKCPVDNLFAEPLLVRWIKLNVPNWSEGVVVSKNPGGTKRATSLADALKLGFGIVTTEKRRPHTSNGMNSSSLLSCSVVEKLEARASSDAAPTEQDFALGSRGRLWSTINHKSRSQIKAMASYIKGNGEADQDDGEDGPKEVVTGRLIHGHIVDDDAPSPTHSATSARCSSSDEEHVPESMMQSIVSGMSANSRVASSLKALGGTADAANSDDEEEEALKDPEMEHTVTLIGNVKDKDVFIVDDMIDQAGSWIAAAETVVKRGGAKKVYCMATHGLFGNGSLEELEECEQVTYIVVTNAFPIPEEKKRLSNKLIILPVDNLLAEAIRRNHHGESISQLAHYFD